MQYFHLQVYTDVFKHMSTYIICAWVGKSYVSTCISHMCVLRYIHICMCMYILQAYIPACLLAIHICWMNGYIICMKTVLIDLDAIMILCLQKLEPHWGFGKFDTLWDVDKDKVAIPYLVVVASWFKTLRWCSERILPISYLTLRKEWPCVRNRPKLKQRRITAIRKLSQ